jgi:predicted TPR repeat methyltransferase
VFGALVVFAVGAAVDFHWDLSAVTAPVMALGASAAVHTDARDGFVRASVAVPALGALAIAAVLALAGNTAIEAGNANRAVRLAPYSPDSWMLLGDSRRSAGDLDGAAIAYRHATRLDPNDWHAWVALAAVARGEPRRFASAKAARLNPLSGGP